MKVNNELLTSLPPDGSIPIDTSVTADGQRFLLNAIVDTESAAPLTVVVNWTTGMQK